MDYNGFYTVEIDHKKVTNEKLGFCQNADCPKKGEQFVVRKMVKSEGFSFCSRKCKEAVFN